MGLLLLIFPSTLYVKGSDCSEIELAIDTKGGSPSLRVVTWVPARRSGYVYRAFVRKEQSLGQYVRLFVRLGNLVSTDERDRVGPSLINWGTNSRSDDLTINNCVNSLNNMENS